MSARMRQKVTLSSGYVLADGFGEKLQFFGVDGIKIHHSSRTAKRMAIELDRLEVEFLEAMRKPQDLSKSCPKNPWQDI